MVNVHHVFKYYTVKISDESSVNSYASNHGFIDSPLYFTCLKMEVDISLSKDLLLVEIRILYIYIYKKSANIVCFHVTDISCHELYY